MVTFVYPALCLRWKTLGIQSSRKERGTEEGGERKRDRKRSREGEGERERERADIYILCLYIYKPIPITNYTVMLLCTSKNRLFAHVPKSSCFGRLGFACPARNAVYLSC